MSKSTTFNVYTSKPAYLHALPKEYDRPLWGWMRKAKFLEATNILVTATSHDPQFSTIEGVKLKIFFPDAELSIAARLPEPATYGGKNEKGYLGGIISTRVPRPGETWCRGNDLADGPFSEQTWNQIMADALSWMTEDITADLENIFMWDNQKPQ